MGKISFVKKRTENRSVCPEISDERSLAQAISVFVIDAFWSGSVLEMSPTKLVSSSRQIDSVEVNTFTGAEADMAPLIKIAEAYEGLHEILRSKRQEARYAGLSKSKYILVAALGLEDAQEITWAAEMGLDRLVYIYALMAEEGISFHEGMSLAI